MSSKGKRRREARRRARQRQEAHQLEDRSPEEGSEEDSDEAAHEERSRAQEAVRSAAEARHGRASRKRARRGDVGLWGRLGGLRVSPWLIATPVAAIGVVVLAVLILTSGSSGAGGGASASPTPDPRVAGSTPDVTIDLQAGGGSANAFFSPNAVTANAGDVVEFVVTNTGSVSHNLVVAGLDDQYETADDFESVPFAIEPGETGRVVVKLDEPGTYRFRCSFHPLVQTGTLILE